MSPDFNSELDGKLRRVEAALATFGRVLVAFSGGVDSTLLAKLARDVLGRANVVAVTADSPSLAREELAEAVRLASRLDLDHRVIATHEVEQAGYQANSPARCYVCKRELFHVLEPLAAAEGIPVVLYGAIGDDRPEERPGQRAARQFRVRAPLQEAGLAKREVRALARQLGLPNWDRPQNACLASRVPHGQPVTEEKLRQVEQAEAFLRAQGFRQVRVRHLGAHARIEVGPDEVRRFHDPALGLAVAKHLEVLGFETVGVDRTGYRPGGASRDCADELLLSAIGVLGSDGITRRCSSVGRAADS